MTGNKVAILSVAVFIIISLVLVGFFYNQNQNLKKMLSEKIYKASPTPTIIYLTPSPIALPSATPAITPKSIQKDCTQEAKLCPDGSYVGRTGPNCEFSPCTDASN